jgi:hypothetical protein
MPGGDQFHQSQQVVDALVGLLQRLGLDRESP